MNIISDVKAKLDSLKFADYFQCLNEIEAFSDLTELRPLKVAILRSYTADLIESVLKVRLYVEGYKPDIFWGQFNQFSQEILDEESPLYKFKPDIVLLLIRIDDLLPQFVFNYGERDVDAWSEEMGNLASHIINLLDVFNMHSSSQVILQNMSLVRHPYWGIFDAQSGNNQLELVNKLNQSLRVASETHPNSFIWDFADFVSKYGSFNLYDVKAWYISRNPYKQSAYVNMGADIIRYILSALGKGKKCIVLDLDNTIWGGIIGEDGMDGIALGQDYPGSCYVDFQKELLKLYNRGIILAINSKNNEADAFDVIDNHPYMVLRRQHFAAYEINWNDKASNLQALADELNIGIDSMIMIDDNPVECELIRQQCPQCLVIQLPTRPYLIPSVLDNLPEIENIRLTEEDKKKGVMYQQQLERKKLESTASNLGDYLHALDIKIEIKVADTFSIPRISQLTQKTNQFNMTTRRYTEADIIQFVSSKNNHVYSIASTDRFGDNGIIGVVVFHLEDARCTIDTFLLSCRVIGRTIEKSIVAFVAEYAKKNGAKTLIGEFFPTAKNKPAADVYEKMSFEKIDDNNFVADLTKQTIEYSPFVTHKIVN